MQIPAFRSDRSVRCGTSHRKHSSTSNGIPMLAPQRCTGDAAESRRRSKSSMTAKDFSRGTPDGSTVMAFWGCANAQQASERDSRSILAMVGGR